MVEVVADPKEVQMVKDGALPCKIQCVEVDQCSNVCSCCEDEDLYMIRGVEDPYSDVDSSYEDEEECNIGIVAEVGEDMEELRSLFEKESCIDLLYKRLKIEAGLLRFENIPKIVNLSYEILTCFKDKNEDVTNLRDMVNQVLENYSFQVQLRVACKKSAFIFRCVSHFGAQNLKPDDQISRIREDSFLKKAIKQGEDHEFFAETLKVKSDEMVVRGALCILLTYCINEAYLNPMGIKSPIETPKRIEDPPKNWTDCVFKFSGFEKFASVLKDCAKIVDLSREILEAFFKAKDLDVGLFFDKAGEVFNHAEFVKELKAAFEENFGWISLRTFAASNEKTIMEPASWLFQVRKDKVLKQAIEEREKHWFYKNSFAKEDQMVVRCAVSIILPYCVRMHFLDENGIWFA